MCFIQMTDANQVWDVQESVDWMKQLAEVNPLWIEEPTSPDDILGHAEIAKVNWEETWSHEQHLTSLLL